MKFLSLSLTILCSSTVIFALPARGGQRGGNQQQQQQQASSSTSGSSGKNGPTITQATDGSTIVDDVVQVNGLPLRFRVSAPQDQLLVAAGNGNANNANNNKRANGAAAGAGAGQGTLGVNILFHGDGGDSFFDFPNQGVNNGLMGVALLSPDPDLRWGGSDPNDPTGLIRPDGVEHSAAVNKFITEELPKIVNFDQSQIFMEGASGGSLLLSGFMIPAFGASLGVPGVVFGCGGLEPQVNVQGDISNIRIHWQSTVNDLPDLQTSIPQSILAYEKLSSDAGLSDTEINQLLTADASPNGGHCEFDEQDFTTGIQLLTDNYSDILSGDAQLNGVNVITGVVGNEQLFGGATATTGASLKASGGTSSKIGKSKKQRN